MRVLTIVVAASAVAGLTFLTSCSGEDDPVLECDPPCLNGGVCTDPELGTCDCTGTGYRGEYCEEPVCLPTCQNDGVCIAPDTCDCTGTGFEGSYCQTPEGGEEPDCDPECENGICLEGNQCECFAGYEGDRCELPICEPACQNGGVCIEPDVCDCTGTGYEGSRCQTPENGEEPICDPPCENDGVCLEGNVCHCPSGFEGDRCEIPACDPACQNGGVCVAPNVCDCSGTGYEGDYCQTPENGEEHVCDPECENGGVCLEGNVCSCPDGYEGDRCELPICDPECQNGGVCTPPDSCDCSNTLFIGDTCDVFAPPAEYCEDNICWPVPPTGQTKCYDNDNGPHGEVLGCLLEDREILCPTGVPADCDPDDPEEFCGQDAQYPGNVRELICHDADGDAQPDCSGDALEDEVVVDSLTGLMWQRTFPEASMNNQAARQYCQDLDYAGYSDWRVPNFHELHSLVDYGRCHPAIDSDAFPGIPAGDGVFQQDSRWWTSSASPVLTGQVFWVDFGGDSTSGSGNPSLHYKVRCVRDGHDGTRNVRNPPRFEVTDPAGEGEEVATDLVTGLIWQKEYIDALYKWGDALRACEILTYAGESDWRLPDIHELVSILNLDRAAPPSDFPGMDLDWAMMTDSGNRNSTTRFWSSTTRNEYTAHAWALDLLVIDVAALNKDFPLREHQAHARCVRDGP